MRRCSASSSAAWAWAAAGQEARPRDRLRPPDAREPHLEGSTMDPGTRDQEKTVRVFVSSTFRDMHAERDVLDRVVFPELRSRCRQRGADFIGVDLRWGVTEEEAETEGALALCLREIERCRPFFVCMLGER